MRLDGESGARNKRQETERERDVRGAFIGGLRYLAVMRHIPQSSYPGHQRKCEHCLKTFIDIYLDLIEQEAELRKTSSAIMISLNLLFVEIR